MKERITTDFRNAPSTTDPDDEEIVDAPGKDGKASMPEQVKRTNPWRKTMMTMIVMISNYKLTANFTLLNFATNKISFNIPVIALGTRSAMIIWLEKFLFSPSIQMHSSIWSLNRRRHHLPSSYINITCPNSALSNSLL